MARTSGSKRDPRTPKRSIWTRSRRESRRVFRLPPVRGAAASGATAKGRAGRCLRGGRTAPCGCERRDRHERPRTRMLRAFGLLGGWDRTVADIVRDKGAPTAGGRKRSLHSPEIPGCSAASNAGSDGRSRPSAVVPLGSRRLRVSYVPDVAAQIGSSLDASSPRGSCADQRLLAAWSRTEPSEDKQPSSPRRARRTRRPERTQWLAVSRAPSRAARTGNTTGLAGFGRPCRRSQTSVPGSKYAAPRVFWGTQRGGIGDE